jgi:hypothetical protein
MPFSEGHYITIIIVVLGGLAVLGFAIRAVQRFRGGPSRAERGRLAPPVVTRASIIRIGVFVAVVAGVLLYQWHASDRRSEERPMRNGTATKRRRQELERRVGWIRECVDIEVLCKALEAEDRLVRGHALLRVLHLLSAVAVAEGTGVEHPRQWYLQTARRLREWHRRNQEVLVLDPESGRYVWGPRNSERERKPRPFVFKLDTGP